MEDIGLHCYRPRLLQKLKLQNHLPLIEFCEWYLIMKEANLFFERKILWSDEVQLNVNGRVNRHNCVYWVDAHPLEKEVNSPEVIIWTGMHYRGIVRPFP